MKVIHLIFLVFICHFVCAQSIEKEMSLVTGKGNIQGTLLMSPTDKKQPLVLFIAGSGPTDRNGNNPMMTNNSLKMLAEKLTQNNIASLRYDKRGIAASKDAAIDESELRFEDMINDAKGWIDTLSKDDRFSSLIILGHSEGSTIGMVAAQTKLVSKFISLAGPGMKAKDKIMEQLKVQAPYWAEQAAPIFDKIEKGEMVDDVPPLLFSVLRPSVQPYMHSWFQYDPRIEIAKLNKPVMIIQGTTDLQVSIDDAKSLHEAQKNAELKIIDNMNHVLKVSELDQDKNLQTYSDPDLPLIDGLVSSIVKFIQQ